MNNAITIRNLSKIYPMSRNSKEKYLNFLFPGKFSPMFRALGGIDLDIKAGESVGLIGMNGSGKSTLANIIAGASAPTGGTIDVVGDVAMSSIAAGVNSQLTGEENIVLKCLLLGMDQKQIDQLMPEIIDFSELGTFIKQPTKTYSSGMRSKLAFAISSCVDPDILVIDEALSVGDSTFTQKCLDRMKQFQAKGKTIIFVSHAMPQLQDFCDRAAWLEAGKLRMFDQVDTVVNEYNKFVADFNKMSAAQQKEYKNNLRNSQIFNL